MSILTGFKWSRESRMMRNERARDISQLWIYAYNNVLHDLKAYYYANCLGWKHLLSIYIVYCMDGH